MSTQGIPRDELEVGTEVVVKAKGKRQYATRLILGHFRGHDYISLTPQGEILQEDLAHPMSVERRTSETNEIAARLAKHWSALEVPRPRLSLMSCVNVPKPCVKAFYKS